MDKDRAKELYGRLSTVREQLTLLNRHLDELADKIVEVQEMLSAVQQSDTIKQGDELLVPLVNGIMVRAKAVGDDELLVNVGANTTVKRNKQQVIELLSGQLDELLQYQETLSEQEQQLLKEEQQIASEAKK
jgi:prefoldin alpha subunit